MTLDELKKLAEAATPGPWFCGHWTDRCRAKHEHHGPRAGCIYEPTRHEDNEPAHDIGAGDGSLVAGNYDYEEGGIIEPKDTAFIVATNPATVLKLLEIIAALKEGLRDPFDDHTQIDALRRASKIERSLGELATK